MRVACRLLGPGDAALLDRVAPEVFDEPVRPDRARAYLAAPGHLMVAALDGDLVVGQCAGVIHRHPDKPAELYVDEVGVAPGWQRRGIARAMLARLLSEGRLRGCEEAWVGTECDNAAANALYRALGASAERFNLYLFDLADEP